MSDIHGNLPALELVLNDNRSAELFISLGDVVNYGPWSDECVELLETLSFKVLLKGNHENNFLAGNYPGKNTLTKTFHDHCIKFFNNYKLINVYNYEYLIGDYLLKHTLNNEIVFSDTNITLTQNTIIGHSHKQYISNKGNYLLINPGSVGQNRQFINVVSYMLWDTVKNDFQIKNTVYDVEHVISKMKEKNYPEICIDYYISKNRL